MHQATEAHLWWHRGHLQLRDTRLWSDFHGSVPPPRWAIQIRPAAHSLLSTFPWKSIHLYSLPHLLPDLIHPTGSCTPNTHCETLSVNQPLLYSYSFPTLFLFILTCLACSGELVFPIPLPERKKKKKQLSTSFCRDMRIMVSQRTEAQLNWKNTSMDCYEGDGPCVTVEVCKCTFQNRREEEKEGEKYMKSRSWKQNTEGQKNGWKSGRLIENTDFEQTRSGFKMKGIIRFFRLVK